MSAYLMSDLDTAILAIFAKDKGLCTDEYRAARILRSANNAALFSRYGDKAQYLKGFDVTLQLARSECESWDGQTNPFIGPDSQTRILQLAKEFQYQCAEGDFSDHKGYILLGRILRAI